ncbi:N-acetyltransferase [Deinococcus aetherius]|uniref:N-acetyltransferase n=1 Tax=Deinococcus aetherius TaxID=200252 RepID=A0ABN6RF81_9DEIO|nr:GNAT family N-acetyltransferase [Deinococcus aetherius]BDP40529.1 N-acetyltransferase [Deinococcus aetherius]
MPTAPLPTPRLWLLPLTRAVVETRLRRETFQLPFDLGGHPVPVHFAPAWPGDLLPVFPLFLADFHFGGTDELPGSWIIVERTSHIAVGTVGTKGDPDAAGLVEIGYGLTPEARGRGLMTEAGRTFLPWLLARPDVRGVTAQTARGNRASERVLEGLGFARTGEGWSVEDGPLTVWTCVG